MADQLDTISAIATPSGPGGIGIVRVSGGDSFKIAHKLTRIKPAPRQAYYATFKDRNDQVIDRGILLYFRAPQSFTGEDIIELHGHGGTVVLNMVLSRIIELGARHARPGEFTERAFLNNKIDLFQAESIADLINCGSEKAARSAMRSLDGEFSAGIQKLVDRLVTIRSFVEGALDFPEEEIDFLKNSDIKTQAGQCLQQLDNILTRARAGSILRKGIRLVIAGQPNVGKSSLLNKLTQTNKAIVTPQPGTTRDIIEDNINVGGIIFVAADTAGIRESADPAEQEGVKRALNEINRADVVLVVTEADDNSEEKANYIKQKIPLGTKTISVRNKIDLHNKPSRCKKDEQNQITIYVSAKTGAGMELLEDALIQIAEAEDQSNDPILARARHIDALERARSHLNKGLDVFIKSGASELLAEELHKTQQALGEITGTVTNDDILGEIFSRFCIGK